MGKATNEFVKEQFKMINKELNFTPRQRKVQDWTGKVTEADQDGLRKYLQDLLEGKTVITAVELAEAFKFYKDLDIKGLQDSHELWHPDRIESERIFAREGGHEPHF